MRPLHIAVAGLGVIGREHVRVIQANPNCVLSAVVDPSPAAQQMAHSMNVPCFATLQELLHSAALPHAADAQHTDAQHSLDGVILATPNALHVEQALACIAKGVAVLVEKPIATTVQEAQALVDATQVPHKGAGQAKVLIGHHRAHSPLMAQAKAVVDSGRLGRLVSIVGTALFYKPDSYFDEAPWRKQAGGGPILINLIHEIHNLRMLCGDVVQVQAMSSNAVRGHVVEDTAAINFRFANGALGTFMLSDCAASARSWEQTSQENKAYSSYDDEDCYLIAGTHGSLAVPTLRLKTYANAAERSWFKPFESTRLDVQRDDPLVRQLAHFLQVIRGEAQPIVSARDGLENLKVVESIAKALQAPQL